MIRECPEGEQLDLIRAVGWKNDFEDSKLYKRFFHHFCFVSSETVENQKDHPPYLILARCSHSSGKMVLDNILQKGDCCKIRFLARQVIQHPA
jgi:hypothetical protein